MDREKELDRLFELMRSRDEKAIPDVYRILAKQRGDLEPDLDSDDIAQDEDDPTPREGWLRRQLKKLFGD